MLRVIWLAILMCCGVVAGQWRVLPATGERTSLPEASAKGEREIRTGEAWANDEKFRWMVAEIAIPETIDGNKTAGQAVGLKFNCGDGGEVWVNRELESRYDNDHPALVMLTREARANEK